MSRKTQAVAVLPSENEQQAQLQKVLRKINAELKALGADNSGSTPMRVNSNFKFYPQDQNQINLYSCGDSNLLALMLGFVTRMKSDIESGYESVGVKDYLVPTHLGIPLDNWIHDLSIRLKLVANAARIRELELTKDQLVQFTTKQQRLQDALEKTKELFKL